MTKPNTSCKIKKPASLCSDGVQVHPGMPFGFLPETAFGFAGILTVDGSGFDKEYCLNLTGLGHDFVSGQIPNGMEGFARVMQKLGYDDAQIAQWRARREPSRPHATITPADYWEFVEDLALWGSDRDRAEFVRQALSLR